ncbi:hypothetical protein A2627_01135 [Candidatus Woesebacteria bacterium RIFCSPHIGHO2_01_FULL_39_28]|uniref:Urease accessory protein UreH-like transmembrane domain-containing protein n=1 Tax=Candidatus Woesebacteria bacterium RIFCSPHIGHO2_01_FULL_39_28 TaxID=1802496 RepID=A0A1F7YJ27_9BACT|nr:MAG: hypothetical protein A2627_01135 [Candidatus Woesebacteria bacterium RIFCSPHIGHO2_01_FULL_39_28]OGM57693.1 MAG: hypothetical protein A3A50_01635 [Candidatus Woesebacteria bacterium RIFCSPLOWO2_01_FULL_38_20]
MGENSINLNKFVIGIFAVIVLIIGFLFLRLYSLQNPGLEIINLSPNNISLLPIFLTGLITGGLTCLAVQGGLLASTIAMQEEERLKDKTKKTGSAVPILTFLTTKLVAYTILGFLLGWFGSLFQLSLTVQVIMQFVIIIFMLGTALNILEVHPVFRYFAFQPPRFITRRIRSQSKSQSIFAPAILGALTIFIPCGTTQAIMALAIGSGKPLLGAAILFAFILGTTPLFFILGYFATKLGDTFQKTFMKVAAMVLILLALFNLRNAFGLAGINLNISIGQVQGGNSQAIKNPTIELTSNGYNPQNITVKAGSNITLNLKNTTGSGCIQSFVIPKFGIQKVVREGTSEMVSFVAPGEKGQIAFMCGMGMFRGTINVI